MNIKWVGVIILLMFFILVNVWVCFISLDKKINKAIEKQEEINKVSYELNDEQSKKIRLLETESSIFFNIVVNQDYTKEN